MSAIHSWSMTEKLAVLMASGIVGYYVIFPMAMLIHYGMVLMNWNDPETWIVIFVVGVGLFLGLMTGGRYFWPWLP